VESARTTGILQAEPPGGNGIKLRWLQSACATQRAVDTDGRFEP
jgi:hypothetical protein